MHGSERVKTFSESFFILPREADYQIGMNMGTGTSPDEFEVPGCSVGIHFPADQAADFRVEGLNSHLQLYTPCREAGEGL